MSPRAQNCLPTSTAALDTLGLSYEIWFHVGYQLCSTTSMFMLQMKEKVLNCKHHNEKNLEISDKTIYKKSIALATDLFKFQLGIQLQLLK